MAMFALIMQFFLLSNVPLVVAFTHTMLNTPVLVV